MMQSLLSNKLLEKLISSNSNFTTVKDTYDMFPFFIEIYRSDRYTSPDLVWTEETRNELKSILENEKKAGINGNFADPNLYENYLYTDQSNELLVEYSYKDSNTNKKYNERIYIKYLNKDVYFTPSSPIDFLEALIDKLDDVKTKNKQDSFEIIMSIRGCISSQQIIMISDEIVEKLLNLLHQCMNHEEPNNEIDTN